MAADTLRVGSKVMIQGFLCKVLGTGMCEDSGCVKPTVTIIDPEGNKDTVHLEDCDGGSDGR